MKKLVSFLLVLCLFATGFSSTVFAREVDKELIQIVRESQEIKNNPDVVDVVESDAPDADEWWNWFDSLPLDDEKYVSKRSISQWVQWYASLAPARRANLNYNPIFFASNNPTVSVNSLLPTGGDEHIYEFWKWEMQKDKANCYAYVLNTYGNVGYRPYPGSVQYGGNESYTGSHVSLSYIKNNITQLLATDAPYYNGKTITSTSENARAGTRQYKIAVVFTADNPSYPDIGDFHFYRQDYTGYWSHKLGFNSIRQTDASGNMIENPRTADRDHWNDGSYNYSKWGGFYMVTY